MDSLQVLSFNILGSHSRPPHSWEQRRPHLVSMWQRLSPDIVGIQEGRAHQVADIVTSLPEYEHTGLSRSHSGDESDEQCAIFTRRERFEVLESGHFWLSDTPDVPASRSWGNTFPRMVTWATLRERKSGAQLALFNTHFDHLSEEARRRSALLLRDHLDEIARSKPQLALIVTGDFNERAPLAHSPHGAAAYQILTAPRIAQPVLRDALLLAPRRGLLSGTFHGFSGQITDRIDWILCNGALQIESAQILDSQPESQQASDHFGVAATFSMPQNPERDEA